MAISDLISRLAARAAALREINTADAKVYDGDINFSETVTPSGTEHPLLSGLALRAGKVRAWDVKTDETPASTLSAVFISEDETVVYPGTPEGPPVLMSGEYVWKFKWENLPALGCNGTLRFSEVLATGMTGATSNHTVHVVDDQGVDPCLGLALADAPDGDDDWT